METINIKKIVRSTSKVITSAAIILVVLFALLIVGVKLLGIDVYIVLSPSMEPEIKTGSVIYTRDAVVSELEKGDVITFDIGDGKTATHRIDEVIGEGENKSFITKGDANDEADGKEVLGKDVIGVCVFSLPYLGFVVDFIQTQMGIYVCIGAVALIIVLMVLPDILFGEEETKTKKGKKAKTSEEDGEPTGEQAEEQTVKAEDAKEEAAEERDTEEQEEKIEKGD